jgi:hypothetical protein
MPAGTINDFLALRTPLLSTVLLAGEDSLSDK